MWLGGILVITANVDVKLVNRLLLSIRHYPYTEDFSDAFTILRTIDPGQTISSSDGTTMPESAEPPLQSFSANEWAGLSIEEVEKLMLAKDDDDATLFFVLDDQGVRDQTLVLLKRADADEDGVEDGEDDEDDENDGDNDPGQVEEFNKLRIPWFDVFDVWVNLFEANLSLHDFCAEGEVSGPGRRWLTYDAGDGDEDDNAVIPEFAAAVKALEEKGLA